MADNVTANTGSGGATFRTDDDGSAHWPYTKIAFGADNTQTIVTASAGLPAVLLAGSAAIGKLAANSGVDIGDVDILSVIPGAGATNLGKAEDAAHSSADVGVMALSVRQNTAAATSGADGDYQPLITDTNGRLHVNDVSAAAALSGSEFQVDVVAALPAGTNAIGKLAANSGVDIGDVDVLSLPSLAAGTNGIGKLTANSGVDIGDVDVTSISAGSNLIGDVGISGARTSGGTTLYKNIDVDESEDQIKGTAGQVYWVHAMNLSAAVLYLKFYNVTAAGVTVGTTVPDLTFPLPTQGDTNGAGFTLPIPNGIAFGTAITIAATTGIADNDSGAPGANTCVVNLGYA